jgi:hypothetical protein
MTARDWLRIGLDPSLLFEAADYTADRWQVEAMRNESERVLFLASRQVGKSLTTAMIANHQAIFHDDSLILLFAPSERQSLELFRRVVDIYHRLDDPVPIERELATTLELGNGSRVISLPGNSGTVRGYAGVSLVVVDEAALVPTDELFAAVMPMLATTRGRCILLSTPFGRRGFFHQAYNDGDPAWTRLVARATECPRISADFLAEQRRTLGERIYSQEYECCFVDTLGQAFSEAEIALMFKPNPACDVNVWSDF